MLKQYNVFLKNKKKLKKKSSKSRYFIRIHRDIDIDAIEILNRFSNPHFFVLYTTYRVFWL